MFDCRSKTTQAFFFTFNFWLTVCVLYLLRLARVIIWIEESLCVMGGVEAPYTYIR